MAQMHVEIVGPDRKVWSGDATVVVAKTIDGEVGVLPHHAPFLAVLANGVTQIHPVEGQPFRVAVLGGFISVADNQVTILAESAELADDIEAGAAEDDLRAAQEAQDEERVARARARVAAASGRIR